MKKLILLLSITLINIQIYPNTKCFLIQQNELIVYQEGNDFQRHSPCSTFKIAISLMGFNEGILKNQFNPYFSPNVDDDMWLASWQQEQNPSTWILNSCVWYSQRITKNLGIEKFKKYISDFNYGNQNISGDIGKNNGLTNSWLSSSLQISCCEQLIFLQKLINNELPVSLYAHEQTRNILFIKHLTNVWDLYGKTGGGHELQSDGTCKRIGWFVGWLQQGKQVIFFVHYVEEDQNADCFVGKRAKIITEEKLLAWLDIKEQL